MATKTIYACQSCGYQVPKWLGRCPECGQWNSFSEETYSDNPSQAQGASRAGAFKSSVLSDIVNSSSVQRLSDIETESYFRTSTSIGELDRVLGGGLVKGSVVLVGGEPGIGKSTLMLQASGIISRKEKVLYVSGEESVKQIKLRAQRLNISSKDLYLVNETNVENIVKYIKETKPYLVVIDSIQTVLNPAFSQSPGTVTQIKESAGLLTIAAKSLGVSVFIIGHITKEGFIAGPKVLEHIVDSVIYFEGERESSIRILRAIKNRFGPTDEVGIFSMGKEGLSEVKDPSGIFISRKDEALSGTAVTSAMEGTRPLLLEIQGLVSPSTFGMPRQRSTGFDFNRLALLIALVEKNLAMNFANYDVFLNVVGGVKVVEPACDLAACIAVISSFKDKRVRQDTVVIGEVGLTSEVRSVSNIRLRVNEAQRIGFKRCIIPKADMKAFERASQLELAGAATVKEACEQALI